MTHSTPLLHRRSSGGGLQLLIKQFSFTLRHSDKYVYCCMIQDLQTVIECLPEADQFSSCEDLIRVKVLRVFIWLLGISALLGNVFVIVTRFKSSREGALQSEAARVQATIVSHLAIADCLMGIYMMIVAFADTYYRNRYAQFAEEWQTSFLCKLAGFLSMLSSEASVFFMCVISVDRFLRIVFPFGRFKMKPFAAKVVIAIVWLSTGLISLIPVLVRGYFGDEFYGRSTVCLALPLTFDRPAGWQYSVAIFLFVNLFAFIGMSFCYIAIYISVKFASKRLRHKSRSEESQLAIWMAFVVVSDLCCWMPIIIMGFLSLRGAAVVPPTIYAWTAVFILPLNSSLNPYIYTFLARSNAKVSPVDETVLSIATKQTEAPGRSTNRCKYNDICVILIICFGC